MNINVFNTATLYNATTALFAELGIKLNSNTAQNLGARAVLAENFKDREPFTNVTEAYFVGLVNDDIFKESLLGEQKISYEESQNISGNYNGLMLFALKLDKKPTRTEISELTRAFNQKSKAMPVLLLLRYSIFQKNGISVPAISLALPERFLYKQTWRQGEKIGKTIILRDINTENLHRGHKEILDKLSQHNAKSFNDLHCAWLDVLNINVLNKKFYVKLMQWYQQCYADIKIDLTRAARILGKDIDNELRPQAVIRIIVRMMFIWFMKQKGLIDGKFFDRQLITGFLKNENTYYNAILQNLFFAVLNKKIEERRFRKENPKQPFNPEENEHGVFDVMRFKRYFKDGKADEFLNETKKIPFINGGLFQCHDYKLTGKHETGELNKNNNYLIDAFSETKPAQVSDAVMFSLIDLFNSYVWTIEESTPEEQDVALDPELLGTVFENIIGAYNPESKENARKASGSFYTPKPIVDYMCRESFKETLKTRFPDKAAQIDDLIDNSEDKLNFPDKNNLLAAITSLQILDPACGSGAFPMGMFNLMVRTVEKLQEHKTTYKNKLDIIQHCIYGVDIQNIAIEISKLRFFISLLVDYQTPDNIADFDVLPNLETKFAVANTLIGIDLKKDASSLFDFNAEFRELAQIFTPFTTAKTPAEKTAIKNAFYKKKSEIIGNIIDKDVKDKIENWNPFNVCYCSPFFDAQIMFGLTNENAQLNSANGYFDVVIGNPPFVKIQEQKGMPYANIYNYSADMLCYFCDISISKFLKQNGIFSFIISNKWLKTDYGKNIREKFKNTQQIIRIVDFQGIKIFEGADVDSNIVITKNNSNNENFITKIGENRTQFYDFNTKENISIPEFEVNIKKSFEDVYITENGVVSIYLKMVSKKSDFSIEMKKGLSTGNDDIYLLQFIEKDDNDCSKYFSHYLDKTIILENKIMRPYIMGEDICLLSDKISKKLFLIVPYEKDGSAISLHKLKSNFPKTFEYLNNCKTKLLKRKSVKLNENDWFKFSAMRNFRTYETEKILIADLVSKGMKILIDDKNYFHNASIHNIPINSFPQNIDYKFVVGLFVSKCFLFFNKIIGEKLATANRIIPKNVENFPIPAVSPARQQPLISLVEQILFLKMPETPPISDIVSNDMIASYLEKVMDACVYELYFEYEIKESGTDILALLDETLKKKSDLPVEKQIEQLYAELNDYKNEIRNRIILQETRSESVAQIIASTNY